MTESISFAEFARGLPAPGQAVATKLTPGVSSITKPNACFVEPTLRLMGEPPSGPAAVLISAPAAVGKSTVAMELARRMGAPLWNLAEFQVGSNTFTGTLTRLFGPQAAGVSDRLRSGDFLLVLDAIDEAAIRAGANNLDAFLDDLTGFLSAPRSKPTVVLCGRAETITWVALYFADRDVPFACFQLEFFDEIGAEEFIDKRLDFKRQEDGGRPVHRAQREPFCAARRELFNLVYDLLRVEEADKWSNRTVREFLGYAPVLVALADYLDNQNWVALRNEIATIRGKLSQFGSTSQWSFLHEIIAELLRREQSKVVNAVRPRMEAAAAAATWAAWDTLYAPDEQCSRLIASALRIPPIESKLPPALAQPYLEALDTQLPQHPFKGEHGFANVVFQEYLYAWALTTRFDGTAIALRRQFCDGVFRPSPLLARFMLTLAGDDGLWISGEDFGLFYESVVAGEAKRGDVELSVSGGSDRVECEIHFRDSDEVILVLLREPATGLRFWYRLAYADIGVDCPTHLGIATKPFALGPAVDIDCDALLISTNQIELDAEASVTLRTQAYVQDAPDLRLVIRNESKGQIRALWSDMTHPWNRYRTAGLDRVPLDTFSARMLTLYKIVLMFRRQRTRAERTVRNARLAPDEGQVRETFIRLAEDRGVLNLDPTKKLYSFNSDYDSLKSLVTWPPQISPLAADFLEDYLGKTEAARLQQ